MDFKGKIAIVTGGAQGIGKAISTALLNAGMKVLFCDVNESSAKSFLEEISDDLKPKVLFEKCDVSSIGELRAVFEKAKSRHGKIDVVINNAGIMNEINFSRMIEVNFIGVINGIRLAFEYMGTNNGGSGGFIVNTASSAGLYAFDMGPVYCGTKHGVVGLTKSYGQKYHFDKTGVTVNAVCPGAIETQLYYTAPPLTFDEKVTAELFSKLELTSPDEVAKAVMKLLQDGRNGQLLSVDEKGIRYVEQPKTTISSIQD